MIEKQSGTLPATVLSATSLSIARGRAREQRQDEHAGAGLVARGERLRTQPKRVLAGASPRLSGCHGLLSTQTS